MTIEFFWMPGGPVALRCLMTLAVKELPYHSRQLDVSKQENRSPEFLAISPSGDRAAEPGALSGVCGGA